MTTSDATTAVEPELDAGLRSILLAAVRGEDLGEAGAAWFMAQVMSDAVGPVRLAATLAAVQTKGVTSAELRGFADTMLARAVPLPGLTDSVDIVGTGGDGAKTVNISTTAALVIAAAGYLVVKHGNRASSSASGSSDVLSVLGVDLGLEPAQVRRVAELAGITFCPAVTFHPSMRFAGPVRSQLGIPTAFNLLGPLTNPAHARARAVGVADADQAATVASVLAAAQISGLVFRSRDGLDELSTTAVNDIWLLRGGRVEHTSFDATGIGIDRADVADIRGGDPRTNARILRQTLAGERGPVRDIVTLNAAAGLIAAATAGLDLAADAPGAALTAPAVALLADGDAPLPERLRAGVAVASAVIDAGLADAKLDRLIAAQRLATE